MSVSSYHKSYKDAGVDVTAGYKAVELMQKHVARTKIPGVLSGLGGFGGLFAPNLSGMKEPVFVSGTDGVGTKLRLAFHQNKHDTIGIDCVAMCVNDVICAGAAPLFFLDYLAVGKNIPEQVEQIVSGIAEGCVQSGCALVGGETAEMPGFYPVGEYDLAGFVVGMVDRQNILDSANVQVGDSIIGIASSGIHSNGFSLVRKVFDLDNSPQALDKKHPTLGEKTLGEVLLAPTKIYVKPILGLISAVKVHSICNITGGGFFENIPRALPKGLQANINRSDLNILPIFEMIKQAGNIPDRDMFGTFNMGIGICVILPPDQAAAAVEFLNSCGESAVVIGQVAAGDDGVLIL